MFTDLKDSTKAVVFTIMVLVLAVGFSLVPGMNGFLYMMTPAFSVLLMMLVVTRDGYSRAGWGSLGLNKLGRKGWAFALLVPVIPVVLGYGIVLLTGLSKLFIPADFQGISWKVFPIVLVVLYVKATIMESMGEELGWRGYLLPRMLGLGKKKAMLLNGLVHGIWHFPIIINTAQYHAGEKLWIILPFTVASTVFLAPVIGTLRLRTGSVWTASMLHTSHNLFCLIMTSLFVSQSAASSVIAGDMGLVVVIFYAALTFYLWRKKSRKSVVPNNPQTV
ncbi:type II CAAX prenyl endopeptidase Rce1 family protein [Paenibacillus sp. GCM10012306]|uniref:CPBP family glutamic-type intramembrane protease n=1 Tax=Paenibacillus sp. GCM10012306 TaxID=3317342 RepID=UPI00361B0A8C